MEHESKEDKRKRLIAELDLLIGKAEEQGFWLYCAITNEWLTPVELSEHIRDGEYIWAASAWEPKDPAHTLSIWEGEAARLEKKVSPLKTKLEGFKPKVKVDEVEK